MPARFGLSAAALALLAACASSPEHGSPGSAGRPAQIESGNPGGASLDWHDLVVAPFGTQLKDSPIPLHEVLLFHDDSQNPAELEARDCYAIDGAPPRLVGYPPTEFLLCFVHDRLSRIDASVGLPADEAAQIFARSCSLWLKVSAPPPDAGDTCEGRDGGIAWSARLAVVPGQPLAALSMTLSGTAERDAEGLAVPVPVDGAPTDDALATPAAAP